jgi:hypothetical protein
LTAVAGRGFNDTPYSNGRVERAQEINTTAHFKGTGQVRVLTFQHGTQVLGQTQPVRSPVLLVGLAKSSGELLIHRQASESVNPWGIKVGLEQEKRFRRGRTVRRKIIDYLIIPITNNPERYQPRHADHVGDATLSTSLLKGADRVEMFQK